MKPSGVRKQCRAVWFSMTDAIVGAIHESPANFEFVSKGSVWTTIGRPLNEDYR